MSFLSPALIGEQLSQSSDEIAPTVFNTLSATDAKLERFTMLGDSLALAVWRRETHEAETVYAQPGHHTFSCYLEGGHRMERQSIPGYGSPGILCALPDEHESRWWVRGHLRLFHIYFLPEHFTRRAVMELDREPRELTLADRTFFENPRLTHLCQTLAQASWEGPDARLRANEITHEILSELLQSQSRRRPNLKLRGGLSAVVRRRLVDFIESRLDQNLSLQQLAEVACLSEYHLARMFRLSFGMAPYAWIAMRRFERAQGLLKTSNLTLQQIAEACGYADLSHFSHRFRAAMGVAPSQYRSVLYGINFVHQNL